MKTIPNEEKYITDIGHSLWVRFCKRVDKKNVTIAQRSFSFTRYGNKTWLVAKAWRDTIIAENPEFAVHATTRLFKRRPRQTFKGNKTGTIGVSHREYHSQPNRNPAWVASVIHNGNSKTKTFSYERDNMRESVIAFGKAVKAREDFVKKYYIRD